MSYRASLRECQIHIKYENQILALKAVKKAMPEAWILNCGSLESLLRVMGYEPDFDNDGNLVDTNYACDKLGMDGPIWAAIAPYTADGDYLEFQGEDFSIWRWSFKNGKMDEIYPELVW